MDNYYTCLEIQSNSSEEDIIKSYNAKITKFNNMQSLNAYQINQIKELKKALYVLTNPRLKELYDIKLSNDIKCMNSFDDVDTLDSQFTTKFENIKSDEKDKMNSCSLGDRIFSLSHMNKKPELNEFNLDLRKPQSTRDDKTSQ